MKHVRTVVFDQSRTTQSRQLVNDFVNTSYFDIVAEAPSHAALREYIVAGRASVGIEIPPDFARRRLNGPAGRLPRAHRRLRLDDLEPGAGGGQRRRAVAIA